MSCELTDDIMKLLTIGILLSVVVFVWLMQRVKRRFREHHPALWEQLDDGVLPLHRRLTNSAKLFVFILLGRFNTLGDLDLRRIATEARLLLIVFLIGGSLASFCQ